MKSFSQDPQDKLLYRQRIVGDTVESASWSIEPSTGVTLAEQTPATDSAMCMVSGLSAGVDYRLTCHLVGASGQEWDRSVLIHCVEL